MNNIPRDESKLAPNTAAGIVKAWSGLKPQEGNRQRNNFWMKLFFGTPSLTGNDIGKGFSP